MTGVWIRRGALVCGIWTLLLVALAAAEFGFRSRSVYQQYTIWWACGVGLMVLTTAVVLLWPVRAPLPRQHADRPGRAGNGAAAPAFAGACLIAGMAWVWGLYLLYFAMPLVVFCLARWRVELAVRRAGKRAG